MKLGHRLVRAWLNAVPVPLGRGMLCRAAFALCGPATIRTDFDAEFVVDPRDSVQRVLFLKGAWEPHTTEVFRSVLRPGDVCVDVGAHIGYHSLLASRLVGPTGRVLAFEPGARHRAMLEENLRRNGGDNVTVFPLGLSDAAGEVVLHRGPGWNSSMGSLRPVEGSLGEERIALARGDEVIEPALWDRVRLVKIDIEGAEAAALSGLEGLLRRRRPPYIVVEVTDTFLRELGSSEEALLSFMEARGFSVKRLNEPPVKGLRQFDALFEPRPE
jgi:FkbM family methyltransferase